MSDDRDREKYPSEAAERFQIRLPPGLRDRIKAYAEKQGRSMNTQIVMVLEEAFPEPHPIEMRVEYLLGLFRDLRGATAETAIDRVGDELVETMKQISDGRITGLDDETRSRVRQVIADWQERWAEEDYLRDTANMDDDQLESISRGDPPHRRA